MRCARLVPNLVHDLELGEFSERLTRLPCQNLGLCGDTMPGECFDPLATAVA